MSEYRTIDRYFETFFEDADVCVLSSHHEADDLARMIRHLRRRCYNVGGVFWSNSYGRQADREAILEWDELLWIENPVLEDGEAISDQLDRIAKEFSEFVIDRARNQ